jgi:hypothetical protein
MLLVLTNNVTSATSIDGTVKLTLPEHIGSHKVFSGVRDARSLIFNVVFCRSLFVILSSLFYPLCCPSICDLRLLITSLAFSNVSSTQTSLNQINGLIVIYSTH